MGVTSREFKGAQAQLQGSYWLVISIRLPVEVLSKEPPCGHPSESPNALRFRFSSGITDVFSLPDSLPSIFIVSVIVHAS